MSGISTETRSVADMLRDTAEWLEAHPEVTASSASVRVLADGRADLETFAAALGDLAQERESYGDVVIEGFLGGERYGSSPYMVVRADVPIRKLGGRVPVKPEYRPILSVGDER